MDSVAKRHPVLTALAVGLGLWFALLWWRHRRSGIPVGSVTAGGAGNPANAPQTPTQKLVGAVDKAQSWIAKAAIVVPPLALLTPKTFTTVADNVKNFFSSGPSIHSIEDFVRGDGTLALSDFNKSVPYVPANAQVDRDGGITFAGTAYAEYVAAWRQAGWEPTVEGDAITLHAIPPGTTVNLYAPPSAPPPKAA